MVTAKFITFEGGEGSGKSTQAERLAARFASSGMSAVVSREPGGTPLGEKIRALILDRRPQAAETELLLFAAARAEHLAALIVPELASGRWVICDRFIDSTRVYQGKLAGISHALIETLEQLTVTRMPDLTLVLDLPPEIGLERAKARGGQNRFDEAALPYHQALRAGFHDIAAREPKRCVVIDGARPADAVEADVWTAVSIRLLGLLPNRTS